MSKKTVSLAIFFGLMLIQVFCNDTHVVIGAGGVGYFSNKEDENISLDYEKITLILFDSYYSVNVDYTFANSLDQSLEYDIGFPVVSRDSWKKNEFISNMIPLEGFLTKVNGEEVDFAETRQSNDEGVSKWYVKKVKFEKKAITNINIQYSSKYGMSGGLGSGFNATYFYGSAYIWKGPIKKIDVEVLNNSKFVINSFQNNAKSVDFAQIEFLSKNKTGVSFINVKPQKDAKFDLWMSKIDNYGVYSIDLNWVKTRFICKPEQYYFLTPEQLRIERNFFYAINGLIFKSSDLTAFFGKMPWYEPKYTNVDSRLNNEEKKAIQIILDLEAKRMQSEKK